MKPSANTLFDCFAKFSNERGDSQFIFDENRRYTVTQAFERIKGIAFNLQSMGIKQGDFVAVKTARTIDCIFVFYALQFIGAVAVMYGPHDKIEYDAVIDGNTLTKGNKSSTILGETHGEPSVSTDSQKTSVIIYTSGSTGESKAVQLSQYNFINNSLDTSDIGGYRLDDINILIVPLHHVFGLALVMTAVVTQHCIFVPERIETEYVLECMEKYGVTRLNGVPSMYLSLAQSKGDRKLKLRCGLIGGGPCTKEQFIKIEKTLGLTLIPVYGMSECIGISCGSYTDTVENRCSSVGRVYSMNTILIGSDGEILIKSPAMSKGYLNGEIADGDGFLHTGDLGFVDKKGYLHIEGRKKDIIIRNGNNLSSLNIERKILSLPEVKDVCVVGVKDELCGEVPCALIVADKAVDLTVVLSKIELPKEVIYAPSVPLTSSGKADKQKVLKLFS